MDEKIVANWVEGYQRVWASNDPAEIGALFSADAKYYTGPFAEPWQGRDGIVKTWIEHADAPGDYTFRYEVLGTGPDCGIVRGWTVYKNPAREYSNIWLIRFDADGKCTEFTEWFKEKPKPK
jgi:hypothetical protein